MSQSSSAAPDVDYKKWSSQLLIAGGVVACTVLIYSRSSASTPAAAEGDEGDGVGEEEARWVNWLLWLILRLVQLVLGGAVLMLLVLVAQQRKILYIPAPPGTQRSMKDGPTYFRSPKAWRLPYDDVMITTPDGVRINAWLIYQPAADCADVPYTLVYFHGNAGNIGHRLENIRDMHAQLGLNILIVDYRGYGDSEDGDGPSQKGFLTDAMATYRWLVERIRSTSAPQVTKMSTDRILIFGRSIGGAVAIRLMSDLLHLHLTSEGPEKPLPLPAGLVLENTFTSLRDMAVQVFPFLQIVSFLLRSPLLFDEWKSSESLDFITKHHQHWCCCLLSGLQDQLVPPAQMVRLHTIMKTRRPKVLNFFKFLHGGHNDTPIKGGPEYWASFKKFLVAVKESEEERMNNPPAALAGDGKGKDD